MGTMPSISYFIASILFLSEFRVSGFTQEKALLLLATRITLHTHDSQSIYVHTQRDKSQQGCSKNSVSDL